MLATPEELTALLQRALAKERFDGGVDSLRCYPLCARCAGAVRVEGAGAPLLTPGKPIVL